MAKKQWSNIIMVTFTDGSCRYVTGIATGHYAEWHVGKGAMEFTLTQAKDIVYGLHMNGYHACIMTVPVYSLYMYRNSDTKITEVDGEKVHCMQFRYCVPEDEAKEDSEKESEE